MSRLTVYRDDAPGEWLRQTQYPEVIARNLAAIGVSFERWASPVGVAEEDSEAAILAAYRPYLDQLMGRTGAGSADVVKLTEHDPHAPALRAKFLNEHVHTEAKIRFFVHGSGNFILHVEDQVYDVQCTQGDLIGVPGGIKHWFDAGERPLFTALRIFTDQAGWVAQFTGDRISERFPASR